MTNTITKTLGALAAAALAVSGCATLGKTPNPYLKDVQYLGRATETDSSATDKEPGVDIFDAPVGISMSTRSYINDLIEHYISTDNTLNERTWGFTDSGERISYTTYDFDEDGTIESRAWCLHDSNGKSQVLIEASEDTTLPVYTYFEYDPSEGIPEVTILGNVHSLHRNREFLLSQGLDWLFGIEIDVLEGE